MTSGHVVIGDSQSRIPLLPSTAPLSRGDIIARTGLPNDVMTFWIRRGLLPPVEQPTGDGRRLRFPFYEANIAAVMNQLRNFGASIDSLLSIAGHYRAALEWASALQLSSSDALVLSEYLGLRREHASGSLSDEDYAAKLDTHRQVQFEFEQLTPRLEAIGDALDEAEFERHSPAFIEITSQPTSLHYLEPSYFWLVGEEWRVAIGWGGRDLARDDGAFATIAVDVSTVLFYVWSRP